MKTSAQELLLYTVETKAVPAVLKYVVCVQRLSKRHWADFQRIAADAGRCHDQGVFRACFLSGLEQFDRLIFSNSKCFETNAVQQHHFIQTGNVIGAKTHWTKSPTDKQIQNLEGGKNPPPIDVYRSE